MFNCILRHLTYLYYKNLPTLFSRKLDSCFFMFTRKVVQHIHLNRQIEHFSISFIFWILITPLVLKKNKKFSKILFFGKGESSLSWRICNTLKTVSNILCREILLHLDYLHPFKAWKSKTWKIWLWTSFLKLLCWFLFMWTNFPEIHC